MCFLPHLFLVPLFLLFTELSNSEDIYKWTDEKNVNHYTNNKASIPESEEVDLEKLDLPEYKQKNTTEQPVNTVKEVNEEENLIAQEEEVRRYWRSRAKRLEDEEKEILYAIDVTLLNIKYLKKDIDFYLLNGYKADFMILELRYLEDSIEPLEKKLDEIAIKKENLRREARKKGIPPGYLRK